MGISGEVQVLIFMTQQIGRRHIVGYKLEEKAAEVAHA